MSDPRLSNALRELAPEVGPEATEDALDRVHAGARRRRRRGRIAAAVAAAAAVAILVAGIAAFGPEGRQETQVVVDAPTSTSAPVATSSTTTSTSTTAPAGEPGADVGTFEDLRDGVTGLEMSTWFTGEQAEDWHGLWAAEPDLADAVAAGVAGAEGVARPAEVDLATMRFELPDGRVVFAEVDLESGWVEPGGILPGDVTRRLRTAFNDAVGRPWEPVDPHEPGSSTAAIVEAAGFPIVDLADVPDAIHQARPELAGADYERWFVEVVFEGHGPVVEIRQRGIGDDSARGFDVRLALVETSEGWQVGGAQVRALCLRSTPGPAPTFGCL